MQFTALAWNLFHGRDFPPDPALFTWRSRLLRASERNETHLQVNRELLPEFSQLLSEAEWDVALLQECPPRFCEPLAQACGAQAYRVLTSRNSFGGLRATIARRNPDLIASGEGGSNVILTRGSLFADSWKREPRDGEAAGGIVERRELTIHRGRPERRTMAFVRIALGPDEAGRPRELCVVNLHATNDRPQAATEDVLRAAAAACAWAGDAPLLFGGDLNLRPGQNPAAFEDLRERFGLTGATAPDAIDHLLVRGLAVVEPPARWPAERRELRENGLALRLSDHAPVSAVFAIVNT